MKKKILFLLPIFSLFIMGNVVNEESISVTVGNVDSPVYSVEVTWDKMEFSYLEKVNYVWNVETHMYDLSASTYRWDSEENVINIKNQSPMNINIELKYLGINTDITGNFDISKSTVKAGKSVTSKLILNGKLLETETVYSKVGSINLMIS